MLNPIPEDHLQFGASDTLLDLAERVKAAYDRGVNPIFIACEAPEMPREIRVPFTFEGESVSLRDLMLAAFQVKGIPNGTFTTQHDSSEPFSPYKNFIIYSIS